MRLLAVFLCGVFLTAASSGQDIQRAPVVLTLDDVVKLGKAGVSEEVMITRIKRSNKPFDLNPDEILELKKSGITDNVVRYLLDPTLPYTPPAPEVAKVAPPPLKDPMTAKLPPESGIYWLKGTVPQEAVFTRLELKPLVPTTPHVGAVSKLGGALKKAHHIGSLVGAAAHARTDLSSRIFYARTTGKAPMEDLVLLQMEPGEARRDLDFGQKPDKPVFPAEAIHQFETKEVEEGLYRITLPALPPGEYIFLILGSGEEKKGFLGKGYDFGVDKH